MPVLNENQLLILTRAGTVDDPYISITDTLKIVNGKIVLSETPDSFTHVSVSGMTEVYDTSPSENQFVVNYSNGVVTFNSLKEGDTVTLSYLGRGVILIPASKVYTDASNPDAIETLQDIIDSGQTAIENLELIQGKIDETNAAIANAEDATDAANTAAMDANAAKDAANTAASDANTAATAANGAASAADTAKTNADAATTAANTATTAANTATTSANNAATSANTAATNAQTVVDNTVSKGVWSSATSYLTNNIVTYNGSGYIALRGNTNKQPDTNALDWALVASKGDTGTTGAQGPQGIQGLTGDTGPQGIQGLKGSNWRGAYSGVTQYAVDDVVSYNGSSYICTVAPTVGTAPTDAAKWGLVAQKGTDGAGSGTVTGVTSSNTDIAVATGTTTPALTLNSGSGANQIVKRDEGGKIVDLVNGGGSINVSGTGQITINVPSGISGFLQANGANLMQWDTAGVAFSYGNVYANGILQVFGTGTNTFSGVVASTVALRTKHEGANTPTGGASGDIRVGNGKIWVNDAGTWKSVAIS